MGEGVATFCRLETRSAIIGSIIGEKTRWMSHPSRIWQAEHKAYQLTLAAQHGLTIPRTVITNSPVKIREAFEQFDGMIVKPVRSGYLVKDNVEHAVYTSRVLEEHLDELESARWSPSIYQEHIRKHTSVRLEVE